MICDFLFAISRTPFPFSPSALHVLYSHRFFGVGRTVAGADDFRFHISNLRFTGSETAGARGKSEHRRATDWLTARRGDPTTSATENKPADGSSACSESCFLGAQVMGETVG
jgi:hypothetical protein